VYVSYVLALNLAIYPKRYILNIAISLDIAMPWQYCCCLEMKLLWVRSVFWDQGSTVLCKARLYSVALLECLGKKLEEPGWTMILKE